MTNVPHDSHTARHLMPYSSICHRIQTDLGKACISQWLTWLFTMPAESARSIKGDIFRSNALSPAPNRLLPQRSVSLRSPIDGGAPPSQKRCRLAKWDDGAVQFNLPGIPQGKDFQKEGGKSLAFPRDHWHHCLNLCRLLQRHATNSKACSAGQAAWANQQNVLHAGRIECPDMSSNLYSSQLIAECMHRNEPVSL